MASEHILPSELTAAARSLERQFQQLGLPSRKIQLTEWDSVPAEVRAFIPDWLLWLLADYSLAGVSLECHHELYDWNREFSFWPPAYYSERISFDDCIIKDEIIDSGYIPISDAGNGDLWLVSTHGDPLSEVCLFDMSGMNRKTVSRDLPHFIAECKVYVV